MVPRPAALAILALLTCRSGASQSANAALDAYLSRYGHEFQRLYSESELAEWESNTRIVEGDSTNPVRIRRAIDRFTSGFTSRTAGERRRSPISKALSVASLLEGS